MKYGLSECSIYDLIQDDSDRFISVRGKVSAEKMCISKTFNLTKDNDLSSNGSFSGIYHNDNCDYFLETVVNADVGYLRGVRLGGALDQMEEKDLERYFEFVGHCKTSGGLCFLSGSVHSPLEDTMFSLVEQVRVSGLSVLRVSFFNNRFLLDYMGGVEYFSSIESLEEFILSVGADLVVLEVGCNNSLLLLSKKLVMHGRAVLIVKTSKSGCHLIEDASSVLGNGFLSSSLKSILFLASMPLINDEFSFPRIRFGDDVRASFWENIKSSPMNNEYILSNANLTDSINYCQSKITLCEITNNSKAVSKFIGRGLIASDYISNFSLSPEWRSIYDMAAVKMRERKVTIDFVEFFVGRY